MLQIFNSVTKQKEVFKPITPGKIGIYVCGVTVYDYCHIGHGRTYLLFDTIIRYLKYSGYDVKYVRNITDIDDKIINRALENHEPFEAVTKRFIQAMHDDEKTLNILKPNVEPRATEYIDQMINLIQTLIDKKYAYVGDNGDVYYEVHRFKTYGCIANRTFEDMEAGTRSENARIEINEAKRNPLDFVLWKKAKPNEPKWPSPWGDGRPGWHTECSVMALDQLGETFDIHGGGFDLKFPHHENERAQSVACTGKEFVNTWMHIGFLQINKEKMSKSLNNFLTLRDFLKDHDAEILRFFNISSHYRSPAEYSDDTIHSAIQGLERLYITIRGMGLNNVEAPNNTEFEERFKTAMNDDFNTPIALSVLFDLAREINRTRDQDENKTLQLAALLKKLAGILGILYKKPEEFLQNIRKVAMDVKEVERLIEARNQARKSKNWSEADKIRQQLSQMGVTLEDLGTETIWRMSEPKISSDV